MCANRSPTFRPAHEDESAETEYHSYMTSPILETPAPTQEKLLEAQRSRHSTQPIAEISYLLSSPGLESSALNAAPDYTNLFEMSQDLEMDILPAHRLGLEGERPMTSTPRQDKKWGPGLGCRVESETESRKQHQEYQIGILKQALEAHEYRISGLVQQRQYALDNVSRLNENIRRRDAEARQHWEHALRREAELEALRERISQMNCEHADARKANEPITGRVPSARSSGSVGRTRTITKRRMAGRPSKIPYYRRDSGVLTTLSVASASGTKVASPQSKN
ncbi:hypothetical protein B0H14DRAFT_2581605 [Mycena olivaceomarginata]|nr:hypothetical protein B0H14DRAFT_2581605 [Mycena olivaceomarginata]